MTNHIVGLFLTFCLVAFPSILQTRPLSSDEDGFLGRIVGVSNRRCQIYCDSMSECSSSIYIRKFTMCSLYTTTIPIDSSKYYSRTYRKTDWINLFNESSDTCYDQQKRHVGKTFGIKCNIRSCPLPPQIQGTEFVGNMLYEGAKIKYICTGISPLASLNRGITTCRNGTWSNIGAIKCACIAPINIPYSSFIFTEVNESIEMVFTCEEGYNLRQRSIPSCNTSTGSWKDLEYVCCDKISDDEERLVKIYSYSQKANGNVIESWFSGFEEYTDSVDKDCTFRNSSVFHEWKNGTQTFGKIKFCIIEKEKTVAYMLFNGSGTNLRNWFSGERLLESSWTDLNASTETQHFRLKGGYDENKPIRSQRYFVSQSVNTNGSDVCDDDTGWFVVSRRYYPCRNATRNRQVQLAYAKNNSVSKLSGNEVGLADRFEVWVEY